MPQKGDDGRVVKWQLTEVSDLGSHGLKGQQHLAQGKRSGTLGIVCWSSHAL